MQCECKRAGDLSQSTVLLFPRKLQMLISYQFQEKFSEDYRKFWKYLYLQARSSKMTQKPSHIYKMTQSLVHKKNDLYRKILRPASLGNLGLCYIQNSFTLPDILLVIKRIRKRNDKGMNALILITVVWLQSVWLGECHMSHA